MGSTSGRLIIVSERARHIWQVQLSETAVALLVIAFFIPFALVLLAGFTFPPLVSDADHARALKENRLLRVETRNLTMKMQRISGELTRLEDMSGRIQRHVRADRSPEAE